MKDVAEFLWNWTDKLPVRGALGWQRRFDLRMRLLPIEKPMKPTVRAPQRSSKGAAVSAQLKEALVALDAAQARFGQVGWFNVIRDALELAARESAAWEAIEAWRMGAPSLRVCSYRVEVHSGLKWLTFAGASHAEALEAAAEWCRGEMAK